MTTLNQHFASVDYEALPQAIRDACIVTARLGQRYLWIDVLCIVQDDTHDMLMELAAMPYIYQKAYLTISATSARSCREGFLQRRDWHPNSNSLRLRYRDEQETLSSVDLIGYDSFDYERDPAYDRARTTQEHLLSPHVLDFTSIFTFFRCAASFTTTSDMFDIIEPGPMADITAGLSIIEKQSADPAETGEYWCWIVEEYTKRKLTHVADKLIGISAVAKWCHDCRPNEYCAELRRSDLLDTLAWEREDDGALCGTPKVYRAPSWSWAAVDGPVSIFVRSHADEDDHQLRAELVDCRVELASVLHPFGAVKSGFVSIRGKTLRARWEYNPDRLYVNGAQEPVQDATTSRDASEEGWPEGASDLKQVLLLELFGQTDIYASRGLILVHDEGCIDCRRVGYFAFRARKKSLFRVSQVKFINVV